MPPNDWRSPATYEGLRSLDAPGFAWEFLTRNVAFERDFERLEQASENGPLSADELTGFARRWGAILPSADLAAALANPCGHRQVCRA